MADSNELLREAACNGNIHSVKNLIHNGASVNSCNPVNGWTALHWAVKRGHTELIKYLMQNGADPLLKTCKGETPSMLTCNETILQLLPTDAITEPLLEEQPLPIVPNYLQNPTFPYADMTQDVKPSSLDHVKLTSNQFSDMKISESSNDNGHSLCIKVRIADSGESDFVEVDVHGTSYNELLRSCCEELEVSLEEVSKLRKLPNVLIRKDKDVARLDNGQELELVLKKPLL